MRNNERTIERGRFVCPSGSPIKHIYNPILNDDGTITLEVIGEENTDEAIEAAAESCSLDVLIQKYLHGDTSVLEKYKPMYMDLTEMPTNYADVLQYSITAEASFNTLPAEIKAKYENNWRIFAMKAGTPEWYHDLGIDTDRKSDKSDSEEEGEVK